MSEQKDEPLDTNVAPRRPLPEPACATHLLQSAGHWRGPCGLRQHKDGRPHDESERSSCFSFEPSHRPPAMIASFVRRAASTSAPRQDALPLSAQLIRAAQPHIPHHGFTVAAVRAGIQSQPSSSLSALNDWNIGRLFPGPSSADSSLPLQLLRRWDAEQMDQVAKAHSDGRADFDAAVEVLVKRLAASEAVRHHLMDVSVQWCAPTEASSHPRFACRQPFSYMSASRLPLPLTALLPLPLTLVLPSSIPNPLPLLSRASRIADESCSLARIDTTFGPEWYARRMRLAAAYFAAEVHLLAPASDLAASSHVLRRIAASTSLLGSFGEAAATTTARSSRPWPTAAAAQPGLARHMHTSARPPLSQIKARGAHGYATLPNQNTVVETFASPFAQFVRTVSALARIIVGTALAFFLACATLYEGTHQYVEHVAMKRGGKTPSGDPWGWASEFDEEDWGYGTDRRLGMLGRHAVRSAWISLHWGTGVAPDFLFGGGTDLLGPSSWRKTASPSLEAVAFSQNALEQATRYLEVAAAIAEKEGVRLPDVAAVRLGLASAHQAHTDAPLDETALRLENRLAATRERVGTPGALSLAVAGYERIFDALSASELTKETTGHSGQDGVPTSRLVRLASKLGDLNAQMGKRREAEAWMLKAVSLAGQGPQPAAGGVEKEHVLAQIHGEEGAGAVATLPTPTPTPTPALTRSLVSSLLSLSTLYASPPTASTPSSSSSSPASDPAWRTGLEEAVRVQAAALRLIRLDLEREQSTGGSGNEEIGQLLHIHWLQHREALTSVHLAETMYALQNRAGASAGVVGRVRGAFAGLFKSDNASGSGSNEDEHASSLQWLRSADTVASHVQSSLARQQAIIYLSNNRPTPAARKATAAAEKSSPSGAGVGSSLVAPEDVQDKWRKSSGVAGGDVVAWRLLRDSTRLRGEVRRMVRALGGGEVEQQKVKKAVVVEVPAKGERKQEDEVKAKQARSAAAAAEADTVIRSRGRGPLARSHS